LALHRSAQHSLARNDAPLRAKLRHKSGARNSIVHNKPRVHICRMTAHPERPSPAGIENDWKGQNANKNEHFTWAIAQVKIKHRRMLGKQLEVRPET
jgi:hypothetical protein